MSLEKQIATLLTAELNLHPSQEMTDSIEAASVKIAALVEPQFAMMAAGASLEAQTIQTLMAMQTATVLAALIEEEGGGRSNMTYSPMKMAEMMALYDHTVEHDGLITTVRINLKETPGEAKLSVQDISGEGAKPQAEPHVYDRPLWVVRSPLEACMYECADRAQAEETLRKTLPIDRLATIENRFCLHSDCPSTGCNHAEVASDTP